MNSSENNLLPAELPDDKRSTALDKIRKHLTESGPITHEQSLMLDKYRAAFSYMCHSGTLNSPGKAIKFVMKKYEMSYSHSAKIVRDTIQLWGDVFKYSKEGLQYLHYERFLKLSQKAQASGDFKAAVRAEEKAAQLLDLFNMQMEGKDFTKLFQFNISFSTDPQILQKSIDITPEED